MAKEEKFTFLSADGKTTIHAVKWIPEDGKYEIGRASCRERV